jgi:hypothetical protein
MNNLNYKSTGLQIILIHVNLAGREFSYLPEAFSIEQDT